MAGAGSLTGIAQVDRDSKQLAAQLRELRSLSQFQPRGDTDGHRNHPNVEDAARTLGLDAERTRKVRSHISEVVRDSRQMLSVARKAADDGFTPTEVREILRRAVALEDRHRAGDDVGLIEEEPADLIEKGRAAEIGEERDWASGRYRKTAQGWVRVTKTGDQPKKQPGKKRPAKKQPSKPKKTRKEPSSQDRADVRQRHQALVERAEAAGVRVRGRLTDGHTHDHLDRLQRMIEEHETARAKYRGTDGTQPGRSAKEQEQMRRTLERIKNDPTTHHDGADQRRGPADIMGGARVRTPKARASTTPKPKPRRSTWGADQQAARDEQRRQIWASGSLGEKDVITRTATAARAELVDAVDKLDDPVERELALRLAEDTNRVQQSPTRANLEWLAQRISGFMLLTGGAMAAGIIGMLGAQALGFEGSAAAGAAAAAAAFLQQTKKGLYLDPDDGEVLIKAWPPTGGGWEDIPRGKRGGKRRPKAGGGYQYAYPPKSGGPKRKPKPAPPRPTRPPREPEGPTEDQVGEAKVQVAVWEAYKRLRRRGGDWVQLADLREALGGVSPLMVTAAIHQLHRERKVHLVPNENNKAITPRDRAAMVGRHHMIAIEEPTERRMRQDDKGRTYEQSEPTGAEPGWVTETRSIIPRSGPKDFRVGDKIKLTGRFLQNTGQTAGGQGQQVWEVKGLRKVGRNVYVITNEPKPDADEQYTAAELYDDPMLRYKSILAANVYRVGQLDIDNADPGYKNPVKPMPGSRRGGGGRQAPPKPAPPKPAPPRPTAPRTHLPIVHVGGSTYRLARMTGADPSVGGREKWGAQRKVGSQWIWDWDVGHAFFEPDADPAEMNRRLLGVAKTPTAPTTETALGRMVARASARVEGLGSRWAAVIHRREGAGSERSELTAVVLNLASKHPDHEFRVTKRTSIGTAIQGRRRAVKKSVRIGLRAPHPKNEHGHRDGLTPGMRLELRPQHAHMGRVLVKSGGRFMFQDKVISGPQALMNEIMGKPGHGLTVRRYFGLGTERAPEDPTADLRFLLKGELTVQRMSDGVVLTGDLAKAEIPSEVWTTDNQAILDVRTAAELVDLIKGRSANPGEVRLWATGYHRKKADGSGWEKISDDDGRRLMAEQGGKPSGPRSHRMRRTSRDAALWLRGDGFAIDRKLGINERSDLLHERYTTHQKFGDAVTLVRGLPALDAGALKEVRQRASAQLGGHARRSPKQLADVLHDVAAEVMTGRPDNERPAQLFMDEIYSMVDAARQKAGARSWRDMHTAVKLAAYEFDDAHRSTGFSWRTHANSRRRMGDMLANFKPGMTIAAVQGILDRGIEIHNAGPRPPQEPAKPAPPDAPRRKPAPPKPEKPVSTTTVDMHARAIRGGVADETEFNRAIEGLSADRRVRVRELREIATQVMGAAPTGKSKATLIEEMRAWRRQTLLDSDRVRRAKETRPIMSRGKGTA